MPQSLTLSGDTGVLSGLSNLKIGHARFKISNPNPDPVEVFIHKAELTQGDGRKELGQLHFMAEDDKESKTVESFIVPEKGGMAFLISFEPVSPRPGSHSVHLTLRANDEFLEGICPIVVERRLPR